MDPQYFNQNKSLIVKVQPQGMNAGDPDLFISKKNQYPSTYDNSEWVCSTYGKDTCAINSNNLKANDDVYIGVRCFQQCQFLLIPSIVEEIELNDGEEKQIYFESYATKIFKIFIRKSISKDEQYQIKSMTINVFPLVPKSEDIILTASTKPNVAPSSASRKGVPGWRKGKTLRLSDYYKDEWCTDCWFTILVDVTDAGSYSILAKSNMGLAQLVQDKKIDDVAFFGDRVCYKYQIQESKSDVLIRVAQYSGMISYWFNPQKIVATSAEAAFSHEGSNKNSILKVSAKDRKASGLSSGLYYLCVQPLMTSTYSIVVHEVDPDSNFQVLVDGHDQNGEVQGKQHQLYIFKIPQLEYQEEDISIEFILSTISGNQPLMMAGFCNDTNFTRCANKALNNQIYFEKAKLIGNDLTLIIDHDEKVCQDKFKGECYYAIVVQGQSEDEKFSKYSINTMHTQNNYYILQEGKLINDYLNIGYYRYYQFSLMEDPTVKNVTFILNTLHGDADIYVSRKAKFPSKSEYEKSSVKNNDVIDEVYFDDDNRVATYYIGIYSFQYSTFSLSVKVDRGEATVVNPVLLHEGVAIKGSIHNEKNYDLYQISIKQVKGFEKDIKIQATNMKGKIKFFVGKTREVSKNSFIWASQNDLVLIGVRDQNFQSDGNYYVAVYPDYSIWNKLYDNYYTYMISYQTEDTFIHLYQGLNLDNSQKANTSNYFRHFVTQQSQDIQLALTIFSGGPELFISLTPQIKTPSRVSHDYDYQSQQRDGGFKGKAVFISQQVLNKKNPSCGIFDENIVDPEQTPCVIYIGVECQNECKYSLKLDYENYGPSQLKVGVPQHGILRDDSFNYYYLTVREFKFKEVFGVLNSISGNADLYIKFQDNPSLKQPGEWTMPSQYDYALKSQELIHQDLAVIKHDDLSYCFNQFKGDAGSDKECAILFGIYAQKDFSSNSQTKTSMNQNDDFNQDQYSTKYNFVAYTDIVQLMNQSPISSVVEEGDMHYYFYQATCDDCGIIISLSTYSSGDPDLYINYGDNRIPSLEQYDIKSTTLQSEILALDLNHEFYKSNKIKSMKGPYIIGVYGTKKSTYTININQEDIPISTLVEGYSLKSTQKPYEISYFMFYNRREEKDFKIQLNVKTGTADIYVSTYKDYLDQNKKSNLIDSLPKSKRNSIWVLENIQSVSGIDQKELQFQYIYNQERGYCSECYFLIGVVTHDKYTEFSILIHALDANYQNSLLIKLGEVNQFQLSKGDIKYLKFIIDEKANFQIIQKVEYGQVHSLLSFSQSTSEPIQTILNSQTITLKVDDEFFQTEKLYYLIISAELDSELTILAIQERQVIQVPEAVPITLTYSDYQDTSKFLLFRLPPGDFLLSIQIQSLSEDFIPKLYVKYYEDIDSVLSGLEFPPGGEPGFYPVKNWDRKLGVLNYQEQFQGVKGTSSALAMNLFDASFERRGKYDQMAQITITTSSLVKMAKDTPYIGKLPTDSSVQIYQVDETLLKQDGFALIEFSQCIGDSELSFIQSPKNINKKALVTFSSYHEYGRDNIFVDLPRDSLYILVKPKQFVKSQQDLNSPIETDFMIKVKYNLRRNVKTNHYRANDGGRLSYTFVDSGNKFNITWSNVAVSDFQGQVSKVENPQFTIVVTKNKQARLDSICALRKEMANNFVIANFETNETSYQFKNAVPGEKYFINVLALISLPYSQNEYEVIPYVPLEINIPNVQSVLSNYAIAFYYWRRTKIVEKQLEFELADVRNVANVHHYQKAVQIVRQERQERYQSLVGSGDNQEKFQNGVN